MVNIIIETDKCKCVNAAIEQYTVVFATTRCCCKLSNGRDGEHGGESVAFDDRSSAVNNSEIL